MAEGLGVRVWGSGVRVLGGQGCGFMGEDQG